MGRRDYRTTIAITTEPVTLGEAKNHIRLTSNTFEGDLNTSQSISPGLHVIAAAFSLVGASVDVLGYIPLVNLNTASCGVGGSITAKIQESDDEISWQDFDDGDFTVVTEANDNAVFEIEYIGAKQFIRVVATVAVASCSFSSDILTETGFEIEDDAILAWIQVAREYCERIARRSFAEQTIKMFLDRFPYCNEIELPKPPLQSVTSVIYKNSDGDSTTLVEDTDYIVDTDSYIGRIVLSFNKSWPVFTAYPVNPVTITYVAGYDDSNPIPEMYKQAILLLVGHWYENREAVMVGAINMTKKIEYAVDQLLAIDKTGWF